MRPIADLYSGLCEVYAIIANDRDFLTQSNCFLRMTGQDVFGAPGLSRNCLELFAGPAVHSRMIASRPGYQVYCVDNSPEMKALACADGGICSARYVVSDLPCRVAELFPATVFDLVFVSRYSIGYLQPTGLLNLLSLLLEVLSNDGAIVFEIHDPRNVVTLFENLPIKERCVRDSDGTRYTCVWPNGPVQKHLLDDHVTMPVRVSVESTSHTETMLFESEEFLYGPDHLQGLASQIGLATTICSDESIFPGSLLVICRRASRK